MMPPRAPGNRRRMRLVDHALQKSLLIALVVMEVVVVAVAIWALYRSLGKIVDDNTYRVHFHGSVDVLSQLISEGTPVLASMLAVNFVALLLADRIWAFYVYGILGQLDGLMLAATRRDFSTPPGSAFDHAVLEQALLWREAEAARLSLLRQTLAAMPPTLPQAPAERAALAARLAALPDD